MRQPLSHTSSLANNMLKLIRAHTVTQAGLLADVDTSYYELSGNLHILFFCFRFFSSSVSNPQPRPRPPSQHSCHGEKERGAC